MKKTKVIIPALGILLLSTAASVTGTVAWFSANASVSATGMSVKAHTDEALVIGLSHNVGTNVTVELTDEDVALIPVSYMAQSDVSGYYYCSNGAVVDPTTGFEQDGQTLTFAKAPAASVTNSDSSVINYYKEYVVYLAAAGQEITGAKLKATVDFKNAADDAEAAATQKAATIDFSLLSKTNGSDITVSTQAISHEKTVNAAQADPSVMLSTNASFPLNTLNDSIPVVMRLYIDGALADDEGNAYVRSSSVNLDKLDVSVTFSLVTE